MLIDETDRSDLPPELVAELSKDLRGDPILVVMKTAADIISLNQILVGLYRQFGTIGKRTVIANRLYRLGRKGLCESIEGMKGVYRLTQTGRDVVGKLEK